jgi:hypothetical protein
VLADGLITDNVGSTQLSDCKAPPVLGVPAGSSSIAVAALRKSLLSPGAGDTGDVSTAGDVGVAGDSIAQQQDALLKQLLADGESMGNCSVFLTKWCGANCNHKTIIYWFKKGSG